MDLHVSGTFDPWAPDVSSRQHFGHLFHKCWQNIQQFCNLLGLTCGMKGRNWSGWVRM